jgi:putative endonuclease
MVFKRGGCVYILTNKLHTVLYTGVTSDLYILLEHKQKFYPNSFTAKYQCDKLVYYNFHSRIKEAIADEKRIKGSSREYKKQLVNSLNPDWSDLYEDLL